MTDASQRYLDIVKRIVKGNRGSIPAEDRSLLDRWQSMLELSPTAAQQVEQRVLRLYQVFLQRSPQREAAQLAEQPSREQQVREQQDIQEAYQEKLRWYEEAYTKALEEGQLDDRHTQERLLNLRQDLNLIGEDVIRIERQVAIAKGYSPTTKLSPQPFQALHDFPPLNQNHVQNGIILDQNGIETHLSDPPNGNGANLIQTEVQPARSHLSNRDILATLPDDYELLQQLLQQEKWQQADRETFNLMVKIVGRGAAGWLDEVALANLPCQELVYLDRLWAEYSQDKFGFRFQGHFYFNTELPEANPIDSHEDGYARALAFSKKVGWWRSGAEFYKYYRQLTFNLEDAPLGHLPAYWFWQIPWWKALRLGGIGASRGGCSIDAPSLSTFMHHLQNCNIIQPY